MTSTPSYKEYLIERGTSERVPTDINKSETEQSLTIIQNKNHRCGVSVAKQHMF